MMTAAPAMLRPILDVLSNLIKENHHLTVDWLMVLKISYLPKSRLSPVNIFSMCYFHFDDFINFLNLFIT